MIALLLVTLYIETHKDNPLQEWLMRRHFGARAGTWAMGAATVYAVVRYLSA